MSIFKNNKKSVVRPKLWKILLSRVAVLLLVGVVVSGVLVGYYNSKLKKHIDDSSEAYLDGLESFSDVDWTNGNHYQGRWPDLQVAMAPINTGRFARVYRDGELIIETKPCVWLIVDLGNDMSYIIDINSFNLDDYDLERGFNSKVMYAGLFMWEGTEFELPFTVFDQVTVDGFKVLDHDLIPKEINNKYGIDIDTSFGYDYYYKSIVAGKLLDYDRTATEEDYEKGITNSFLEFDDEGVMHHYEVVLSRNVYLRNAFDNTGVTMYVIVAFVLGICIILGLIWAIISYFSLKNMYSAYMYRSDLTNKLAHDLKTPLMAISSMAETYQGSSSLEKKDHYVDTIAGNARYMDSLITQTLELARSEAGGSEVNKENFDIKGLVDEICALLESKVETNNLTVDVSALQTKTINSDRMRLKNVITCLMDNAVKYAPNGSVIVINNDGCVMSITNEYKGQIDNVKTLTEPYVRGDKSRSTKGSGLGLAIADRELKNLGFSLNLKVDGGKFTAVVK